MQVRGAPRIGATAAYGIRCALRADLSDEALERAYGALLAARPTAINLKWAVDGDAASERKRPQEIRVAHADGARRDRGRGRATNQPIGGHGVRLIGAIAAAKKPGETVKVLTHCNAGWLAFVDYGSATAPIYAAHAAGIPVHVWVDETRPWLQGSRLTAWELGEEGVPHTLIPDNTGGHLMQHGMVDMVIVGTDRTTRSGDVANKIGTYLKALAAHDNQAPSMWPCPRRPLTGRSGTGRGIPIEERSDAEIKFVNGRTKSGRLETVSIAPRGDPRRQLRL